jgi:hypothetical protein
MQENSSRNSLMMYILSASITGVEFRAVDEVKRSTDVLSELDENSAEIAHMKAGPAQQVC